MANPAADPADHDEFSRHHLPPKQAYLALFALCVGFFMNLLDQSIVAVATPQIMEQLGADYAAAIWVTSAYLLAYAVPVVFGSILWQSAALSFVYNSKGSFGASLVYFLSTRSIQFAITIVLDVLIVFLLFKSNIFSRLGIWPPRKRREE